VTDETLKTEEAATPEKETTGPAENGDRVDTAVEPTLEEQLEALEAESARNLDSLLRAQAELSNARKRFEKQRAMTYVNANAELAAKLLPIIDDFERALGSVPVEISEDGWYSGIELVYRKFNSVLEGMGAQPIEAVGQMFDPNYHEALGIDETDEFESGVVSREMQRGYQLGDRVVRPSLVYVAG
jgi:molecular chaperone GrpE